MPVMSGVMFGMGLMMLDDQPWTGVSMLTLGVTVLLSHLSSPRARA